MLYLQPKLGTVRLDLGLEVYTEPKLNLTIPLTSPHSTAKGAITILSDLGTPSIKKPAKRVTLSLKGGDYDKNHLSYSFERVTK